MSIVAMGWARHGLVCRDQGAVECDLRRGSWRSAEEDVGDREVYEDVKGEKCCNVTYHDAAVRLAVQQSIRWLVGG